MVRSWVRVAASVTCATVLMQHAAPAQDDPEPGSPPPREGNPALRPLEHEDDGTAWPLGEHATGNWFGLRQQLVERGIKFEASLVADYSVNFRGGLDTEGDAFRHLFDATITFDTERLLGLEGGTLLLDFQTFNGHNGIEELVGDYQAFDNIDEEDFSALYQLWYQQELCDGKLRIKVGKVDVSSEFAFVENGAEFITSATAMTPVIVALPTYPDPSTSFNVFVYPTERLYAGVGVYDGAALVEGIPTGTRGPKTFFGRPADLFLIGEVGVKWDAGDGLAGRLGIGASRHTGTFDRVDGSGKTDSGLGSYYLVLDQLVFKEDPRAEDDAQGLDLFAQLGTAERDVAPADFLALGGFTWTGAFPHRDDDAVGLMASYAHFSEPAQSAGEFTKDYELAIEVFYKLAITPWLSVKPDVQYIVNPGGTDTDDALVGTLRVEATF